MILEKDKFHFKQFKISHSKSSMKVGVDAVLLGSWIQPEARRILDIGTGCGIIALMLAQRNPEAEILGIDIDAGSIDEARDNFNNSPWKTRMKAEKIDFGSLQKICLNNNFSLFDLIVSNPPFYNSGICEFPNARIKARHQNTLSPKILVQQSDTLLKEDGKLAMIFPYDEFEELKSFIESKWIIERICRIRNRADLPYKRIMVQLRKKSQKHDIWKIDPEDLMEDLILFDSERNPTDSYLRLCKEFYIKF